MMIKSKLIWILQCVFCMTASFAQEQDLHGLVIVDFKNEYPEGVYIKNIRSNLSSITDMSGSFHIVAQTGDTLLFQGDYLIDREFIVKNSTFKVDPFIVHMNYEVITLSDVVVRAPLTGDIAKDIQSIKMKQDVEKVYANLGIDIRTLDMTPKERIEPVIPRIGSIPIPTSLNIEAIYKTFTGYYRRMNNLNQFEKLEKRLTSVREYLGEDYFISTLGLEKNNIREFLLYVYGNSDNQYDFFYLNKDYLSLDYLFRQKVKVFKERLKARENNDPVE